MVKSGLVSAGQGNTGQSVWQVGVSKGRLCERKRDEDASPVVRCVCVRARVLGERRCESVPGASLVNGWSDLPPTVSGTVNGQSTLAFGGKKTAGLEGQTEEEAMVNRVMFEEAKGKVGTGGMVVVGCEDKSRAK